MDFLQFGWPADYTADELSEACNKNHTNDPTEHQAIRKYVQTKLTYHALLGPFSKPPFAPSAEVSPMMKCPKKNTNERHVIVDLI